MKIDFDIAKEIFGLALAGLIELEAKANDEDHAAGRTRAIRSLAAMYHRTGESPRHMHRKIRGLIRSLRAFEHESRLMGSPGQMSFDICIAPPQRDDGRS